MKKYLKMSDVFDMQPIRLPASWSYEMVAHAVHAIDSHDELVAMNKELLAALEHVWDSIVNDSFEVMNLDPIKSAIAKAKAAS